MADPELEELVRRETVHYLNVVDLIAASNAPTASVRTNKGWGAAQFRSAEGYPGRRPYAGTRNFDDIERLAISRAQGLFRAEHANVQSLSGSIANLAAYRAVMSPGDTLMAMSMTSGGHLSHGHPRHLTSDLYRVVPYTVEPQSGLIDYESVRQIALRERPRAIVAGYSAYPRAIDFAAFARIAEEVDATLIADISHIAGLVAAGLHQNPCDFGALVTCSVEKTLRGTRGGLILCPERFAESVDRAVFPGLQSSVGLAGLVSLAGLLLEANTTDFRSYQELVLSNASALAATLRDHEVPLLTGGTETHMLVAVVSRLGLSGRAAEHRLESLGILSNRNLIPFDPYPPFEASGLRLGTPTITARGFDTTDACEIGAIVAKALRTAAWDEESVGALKTRVTRLVGRPRLRDTLSDILLNEVNDGVAKT